MIMCHVCVQYKELIMDKKKVIKICESWIDIAVIRKDSDKIKKIYSVLDTIDGTTIEKYINEAKEFLKSIKQTADVKEVRDYVKQDREETD